MQINVNEGEVKIEVSELVSLSCRRRERFSSFDNAIKDNTAFVTAMLKQELGNRYHDGVLLSCNVKTEKFLLDISSRVCVISEGKEFTVEHVSSLRYPIKRIDESFVFLWLSEAKCNAYIIAHKHKLDAVNVRVAVFHTETLSKRIFEYRCSFAELKRFFQEVVTNALPFLNLRFDKIVKRNSSNIDAEFPFSVKRNGQKEIAKEVHSAIRNKKNVIINAPTGIGKTASVLYPALKAQSSSMCERVFYLTAKNSGNDSVLQALKLFEKSGFDITACVITAKSKICGNSCSPTSCTFPDSHHSRVLSALFEMINEHTTFTADIISDYARRYQICPFVLQNELTFFSDVVICDYNYVFDESVSVKISASFSGDDAILIDEAHNLIDRLRNIYSARLEIEKLSELAKSSGTPESLKTSLHSFLRFVKNDIEDTGFVCECMPSQTLDAFEREINLLFSEFQEYFESAKDVTLEVRLLSEVLKKFVDLLTLRSNDFVAMYNDKGDPEIFMVNTASKIREFSQRLGTLVLFSATLFPEEYYRYMLGAAKDDSYITLESPFDAKRFLVLAYPLSTKYSDRENTVEAVVRAIWTAGRSKCGNYIAFFPSYQYMALALNTFVRLFPDENVIYQEPSMTGEKHREFVDKFIERQDTTMFAFAVLGGVFSEGIDLVGERLSGAAVVGLGSLPPSRKSAIVSMCFTDLFFDGDKFAYHYPGLNKVFQAGGRVIRSEFDKGFLLIIDDRFLAEENIELLPNSWNNVKKVEDNNSISAFLCEFWQT